MHVNHPIRLRAARQPGALVFAILFTLESVARPTLATVIPLQAYALRQDARDVSGLYFAVGAVGLAGSFTIPLLIRRFRRRWVYSLGGTLAVVAAGALAPPALPAFLGFLRRQKTPAVPAATNPPPTPLRSIRRFLAQPRLRLAW